MIITEAQLHQVAQIIRDHHSAFIATAISPDLIEKDVLNKLKAKGLINVQINSVEQAYLYGQALAQMETAKAANMSFEQFQKWLVKNPIPLTQTEKQAIAVAQMSAGTYCKGLGNKVDVQTNQLMIEADQELRTQIENTIKTATAENIARRESVERLKSDLGHATKDWARDWKRIANTEKHTAMLSGQIAGIKKQYGPKALVFKRPSPSACQHCQRLHLGSDGMPKLFTVEQLEANGVNNVGRKAADWLVVTGATHPHCMCPLSRMPPGWGFDEDGDMTPGGTLGEIFQKSDQPYDIYYAKQVEYRGLKIHIENPAGTNRYWGNQPHEYTHMLYDYGYVVGTSGNDEDEIDVYLGPDPKAPMVYGMHQQNPKTGIYDEDKWMLGFETEELAKAAYLAHYDEQPFLVSITTMPFEHFVRMTQATQPKEGEMMKAQQFIIPIPESAIPESSLQKAQLSSTGSLAPVAGAVTGRAHHRAVNRGSSGPNLLFNVPKMPKVPPQPADGWQPDDLVQSPEEAEHQRESNSRPKEIYYLPEQPINVRPVESEQLTAFISPETAEQVEQNRLWLERQFEQRLPENVDPQQTRYVIDYGRLEKAGPYIGPKGGKWADPQHTIAWNQKKHGGASTGSGPSVPGWASKLASQLGGKVRPHKTDAAKVMLKVPLQSAKLLVQEAQKRGLGAEVKMGGQYAMVALTKDVGGQKEAHAKQHQGKKSVPADKVMQPISPDAMTAPMSGQDWYQARDPVTATIGGKQVSGYLVGFTHDFLPIMEKGKYAPVKVPKSSRTDRALVQAGGERYAVKWKDITPAKGEEGPRQYREAYRNAGKKAKLYKATEEQQKIVREVLENKVVHIDAAGTKARTGQEYIDAFLKARYEVFLNGGIVRDLIQGTHFGEDHTKLKNKMKDIDISVTASPLQAYHVHHGLMEGNHERTQKTLKYNGGEWGTMLIGGAKEHGGGIGIDIKTFSSNTFDLKGKKGVAALLPMDHDMEQDMESRDFTVNCMYYDLHNDVVVDVSGRGLQDAQNRELHIADFVSARKNSSIAMRYLKFRMRGWGVTDNTLNWFRKNVDKQWTKAGPNDVATNIGKNIAKENPNETPMEALARFKDTMEKDGLGHVYKKHVTPALIEQIMGVVESNRNKIFGEGNWKQDAKDK